MVREDVAESPAVRAWILMTIFVILFAGANQFFGLRYVSRKRHRVLSCRCKTSLSSDPAEARRCLL